MEFVSSKTRLLPLPVMMSLFSSLLALALPLPVLRASSVTPPKDALLVTHLASTVWVLPPTSVSAVELRPF